MRSIDGEVESSSGSRSGCPSYNLSVTFGDSSPSRGASGGAEKFPMEDEALRTASASPFGRGVTEGDGEGKPGTKEHLHSDKHWLLIESSYRCVFVLSQHPCPLRRSAPALPKGEPKGILPDGFSPFTQETGRFAQVLLIFFPQMWYIQSNLIFYGLTIFFTVQRRFLYVVLS